MTDVTGVAISWLEVQFLVDKFRKTVQKNALYDDRLPEIRWRFPHQRARWFGMTVLFGARTYLCKFQFVYLLSKADKHICLYVIEKWYFYSGDCHASVRTGSQ